VTDPKAAHQHQTNEDHDQVENGRPCLDSDLFETSLVD